MAKIDKKTKLTKSAPRKTKSQIIGHIADSLSLTKSNVEGVLNELALLAGTEVRRGAAFVVPGIARIKIATRAARPARQGRNPATGEPLTIAARPETRVLRVKAESALRELV